MAYCHCRRSAERPGNEETAESALLRSCSLARSLQSPCKMPGERDNGGEEVVVGEVVFVGAGGL